MPRASDRPTLFELVGEVLSLTAGLSVMLLPLLILAVPGVILFVVLPGLVLAAPLAIAGAVLAPPFLLVRLLRRRRHVTL